MKNSKWFALVALTGVLASCNPLALIPPQKFENNPMQLDGAKIATDALQQLAVGASASYQSDPFADFDKSAMPIQGAAPDLTELVIKINKVQLMGCLTPPDAFKISLKDVKVSVRNVNSETGPETTQSPNPLEGNASQKTVITGGFEYTLDSTKEVKFSFGRDAFDTVTANGNNIASISGRVEADQNSLAGCSVFAVVSDHTLTFSNFR